MLQPHSFLWHYLWIAPHVLQLGLCVFFWRRLRSLLPVFLTYAIFEALKELTIYALDVGPWVSARTFWIAFCIGLVAEGLIKFAVIGELFRRLVVSWPALALVGNRLISGAGAVLVMIAAVAAAFSRVDNPQFAIISQAHILEQSFYIIQCGLILFLFFFAYHFDLAWDRPTLGIALGFAVVWCEHMGTWAVMASGALLDKRYFLDFLNMGTYHLCVLIWCYYLLVPHKSAITSAAELPENNLAAWNRELERLLQ
jgi:hypothetical protein